MAFTTLAIEGIQQERHNSEHATGTRKVAMLPQLSSAESVLMQNDRWCAGEELNQ